MSFVSIDFGTTRCSVVIYLGGLLELVGDPEDNCVSIRSCVNVTRYPINFGTKAAESETNDPSKCVVEIKQILNEEIENLKRKAQYWPFIIEKRYINNSYEIIVNGNHTSTIMTCIFNTLIDWARNQLDQNIEEIILNLPQYYEGAKLEAFRKTAGKVLSIKNVHVITDEMAAALVYNSQRSFKNVANVIIFSQGARSLSASLFRFSSQDPAQLGYVSVPRGGTRYDENLYEFVRNNCSEDQRNILNTNRCHRYRLLQACKEAKHKLTDMTEAHIELLDESSGLSVRQTITRELFEQINKKELLYPKSTIHCLIQQSGIDELEINEIVFVGGATRTPMLRQVISDHFDGKIPINTNISFDHVFACGGAIHMAKMRKLNIVSFPMDFGVTNEINIFQLDSIIENSIIKRLIEPIGFLIEGMPPVTMFHVTDAIPCRREWLFHTPTDHVIPSELHVWNGGDVYGNITDIDYVATLSCPAIPSTPKGTPVLLITFVLNISGQLTVKVKDMCSEIATYTTIPNLVANQLHSDQRTLLSVQPLDLYVARLQRHMKCIVRDLDCEKAKTVLPVEKRALVLQMCDNIDAWLCLNKQKTLSDIINQAKELLCLWKACVPLLYESNSISK